MRTIIFCLFLFTNWAQAYECNPIKVAVNYIKTNPDFLKWVGSEPKNLKFSNIPLENEHKVLVMFDFVGKYSSGSISNVIKIEVDPAKETCKPELEWSALIHPVE